MDSNYDPQRAAGRRKVFVLLSDGDDTIGEWEGPLNAVSQQGIKVYTFGFGSANGSYVPLVMAGGLHGEIVKYLTREGGTRLVSQAQSRTMRDVADRSGGRFFRGESNQQINMALDELLFQGRPISGYQANPVSKDLFQYFLIAAFVSLLIGIFL